MKRPPPLGLVLEGSSTHSAILRLPKLAQELGPIKSSAVRLARRFSNLVQGGYAVTDYEELQRAHLVLLHVPDSAVSRIVDELCASELLMKQLCFTLCETWLTADSLGPLRERGASVATLVQVPGMRRDWFVVEGQLTAARLTRRLIERQEGRAFEIKLGSKHLFLAAELLTTVLPGHLLAMAQQSLRAGGISGNELAALVDQMAQRMLRDVMKGVRLPLNATASLSAPDSMNQLLRTLQRTHPGLALFLSDQLERRLCSKPI